LFEIGASLREARLRQQLDLRDAEVGTKIRTKYLKALEDEQFDLLPAETYVRGFLRTYADHLGLDGQLYVDEFNSRYVADDDGHGHAAVRPRRTVQRPHRARKREGNFVVWVLAAIAVVTALVIVAWGFGGDEGTARIPGLDQAGTTTTARAGGATPSTGTGRTQLLVNAVRGNSWVEAHDRTQAGKLLYQGTLERGQKQLFRGARVWITIGIPANVSLSVNGRRVKLLERRKPTAYIATPTGLAPA
jgi:cytoskeleton protein RodZ